MWSSDTLANTTAKFAGPKHLWTTMTRYGSREGLFMTGFGVKLASLLRLRKIAWAARG